MSITLIAAPAQVAGAVLPGQHSFSEGGSEEVRESANSPVSPLNNQTVFIELYEKVKICRQTLLETRLEVVKKANEAKQRLEELIKGNKAGARSAEALKKDLDTIREAQRVLATMLSDILNAASGNETNPPTEATARGAGLYENGSDGESADGRLDLKGETVVDEEQAIESGIVTPDATKVEGILSGEEDKTTDSGAPMAPQTDRERLGLTFRGVLPSREYLENLIILYEEKTQQLIRIAESLNGIVLIN